MFGRTFLKVMMLCQFLDIRSSHFLPCVGLASIFEVKSYYFHFSDKESKAQNDSANFTKFHLASILKTSVSASVFRKHGSNKCPDTHRGKHRKGRSQEDGGLG